MTFDHAFQVVAADGRMYYGSSADHSIHAADLDSGRELWSFYTEGPVRFAPCVSGGRVYAASDDACLYCLNSRDGRLIWHVRGGPRDERMIGNGQMISRWPARSGVLVDGKAAYFTAGMWGPDGVSIYALDADDGTVIWKNNTSNQQYMLLPHNNFEGITGVSPQGYLALADGVLLVPTGRAMPARFDTATGKLLPWKIAWGKHHRPGSAWTMAAKDVFFSACRRGTGLPVSSLGPNSVLRPEGLMAWNVRTGKPTFSLDDVYRAAFSDGTLYLTAGTYSGKQSSVLAVDYEKISKEVKLSPPHADGHDGAGFAAQKATDKAKWLTPTGRIHELIVAGGTLVAGGSGTVMLLDTDSGEPLWKANVEGQARGLAVASGRLLVSTSTGRIYCFGEEKVDKGPIVKTPVDDNELSSEAEPAREIIESCGIRTGYCLVLGLDDLQLALGLAVESDLYVIVLEQDEKKIAQARRLYDDLGLYGVRIAVHRGSPKRLPYAPYFANLIVVPDTSSCDPEGVYRCLRPSGGVLAIPGADAQAARKWLISAGVKKGSITVDDQIVHTARGPLPDAGSWSHPFGNAGRTSASRDTHVRLPLKTLWFGGPGPARMVDRHRYPPIPVYANGRLFVPAQDYVIAVDAYNGREMWSRELKGVGRFPGNDRGPSVVADDHCVYAPHGTSCLQMDGDTGKVLQTYRPPADIRLATPTEPAASAEPGRKGKKTARGRGDLVFNQIEWNYLAVTDKAILGTIGEARVTRSLANWPLSTPKGRYLFALDKRTGRKLWVHKSQYAMAPKAIVADAKRVCILDQQNELGSIGETILKAIDMNTGQTVWSAPIKDRWELLLSGEFLVAAGTGYTVYDAATGHRRWSKTVPLSLYDTYGPGIDHYQWSLALRDFPVVPPVIVDGTIVAPPRAFDLETGEELWRTCPLSGEAILPFGVGNGGCGTYSACPAAMFMRSGSLGIYDMDTDTGMHWLGQTRPGCWINTLPAGGIVLMPEASSSCTCAYSFQTSLALIADDRQEHWGAYTCEPPKRGSQLKTVSFNFGGVGDKRDKDAKLWLGFPRPFSPQNLRVPLNTCRAAEYYRKNADEITLEGTERPWLYSCGVEGLEAAMLELDLARPAVVLSVQEAPRIDGRLDDPCWDGAEELRLVDDSRRISRACAWLRHDAKNLYIGFLRRAPLEDGKPLPWTTSIQGENAPAWRDDSVKVRFQKGVDQYEYIFLSASGARVTGKSDLRWIMRGTEKELDWKTATHVTDEAWSAEIAVPFDGPAEGQEIFLESFNRTGAGPERTFFKFRSWRRWFVSGGEAELVYQRPAAPSERTFTVRLHFAELEKVRPGERVFDVSIQGKTAIERLDIAAAAGGCRKALTREVKGIRAAETIALGLVPAAGSKRPAILSAVEIEEE
jgi:outer membrane protein assembly factor BamB